jgi:hypothetical protein
MRNRRDDYHKNIIMATKEGIQKDTWWLNELESLGVTPKVKNELNDIQENKQSG